MNDIIKSQSSEISDIVGGWTIRDVISADELKNMPLGMRIEFVPELRAHFDQMAHDMANSELTRDHLKGKPTECLSVIKNALNWGMDPRQVAGKTYAPGKGQIGIEGVLASAIILRSGRVREITYEYQGDWSKVQGKWAHGQLKWPDGKPKTYKNGDPIMGNVPKWSREDEEGLSVVGVAHMTDGSEVRTPEITLIECHPRNAQTWPTAPKRQIIHVAERALCNMICGDILMGVHIDVGLTRTFDDPPPMRDITPVDTAKENLQGEGEVEPGQKSGFAGIDGDDGPDDYERGPVKRKRSPTIRLSYRGKPTTQTRFLRDLEQELKSVQGADDFNDIVSQVETCLTTIGDPKHRSLVAEKADALMEKWEDKLELVEDDTGDASGEVDLTQSAPSSFNLASE